MFSRRNFAHAAPYYLSVPRLILSFLAPQAEKLYSENLKQVKVRIRRSPRCATSEHGLRGSTDLYQENPLILLIRVLTSSHFAHAVPYYRRALFFIY